jgi:hypothetical protein
MGNGITPSETARPKEEHPEQPALRAVDNPGGLLIPKTKVGMLPAMKIITGIALFLMCVIPLQLAEAKSGCCSHHHGVSGQCTGGGRVVCRDKSVSPSCHCRPNKIHSHHSQPTPTEQPPSESCCRHCTTGIPCGDSCISARYTCHQGSGCAC